MNPADANISILAEYDWKGVYFYIYQIV